MKDERLLSLFSHLLSSQIIWHNRIKGLPTSPFPLWEVYKLTELKSMIDESYSNWMNYLEKDHHNETFEEMIFYKDSKGDKHESTIKQIIIHVINHSTHHRAQMSVRMRDLGITPPVTDFIVYSRQR